MRFLVLLLAAFIGISPSAEADPPPATDPLAFLDPFLGDWGPQEDWPAISKEPKLRGLYALSLRRGPTGNSVRMREGVPVDGVFPTDGLLVWDPAEQRVAFIACQADDDLLFKGHYESLGKNRIRRTYEVVHPSGEVHLWRETLTLAGSDRLDWKTEKLVNGSWELRGDPTFQGVRMDAGAAMPFR